MRILLTMHQIISSSINTLYYFGKPKVVPMQKFISTMITWPHNYSASYVFLLNSICLMKSAWRMHNRRLSFTTAYIFFFHSPVFSLSGAVKLEKVVHLRLNIHSVYQHPEFARSLPIFTSIVNAHSNFVATLNIH